MVTVSHPSMSALLTLTVVDLPWFNAFLAAAVQSTANSLQERTWGHPDVSDVWNTHSIYRTERVPPLSSTG